ncbi:unnamed protein product [Urochloa humidicola]
MDSLLMRLFEDDSSSDDDFDVATILLAELAENERPRRRGSAPGREVVRRNKQAANAKLYDDYFVEDPVYGPVTFRRRYRMSRELFLRIANAVEAHDPYFQQKRNAAGELGHSALKKITAALRMLAYGVPADSLDEALYIAESTIILCLRRFVKAVVELFGEQYLRAPNDEDTARLMQMGEANGFPGMLGSIDCMHWEWKNCPTAWHGQFTGHCHDPTIILEAVASHDLWIWHAYFGMPGSHNDINVLHRSPLFSRLAAGKAPPVNFEVNGHEYTMSYYLADGIYPSWSTFVKTIRDPKSNKASHFAKCQEAARKDVERAFGVLQSRFAIVRGPVRFWDQETLWYIMTACVIMHNMIIEDERGQEEDFVYDHMGKRVEPEKNKDRLLKFLEMHRKIEDREAHEQLRNDLVEHLWQIHGQ